MNLFGVNKPVVNERPEISRNISKVRFNCDIISSSIHLNKQIQNFQVKFRFMMDLYKLDLSFYRL